MRLKKYLQSWAERSCGSAVAAFVRQLFGLNGSIFPSLHHHLNVRHN